MFAFAPLPLVNERLPLLSHFGPKRFEAGIGCSVESRFVLRGRYAAQDQSAAVAAEAGGLSFEVRFLKTNQKYLLSF